MQNYLPDSFVIHGAEQKHPVLMHSGHPWPSPYGLPAAVQNCYPAILSTLKLITALANEIERYSGAARNARLSWMFAKRGHKLKHHWLARK